MKPLDRFERLKARAQAGPESEWLLPVMERLEHRSESVERVERELVELAADERKRRVDGPARASLARAQEQRKQIDDLVSRLHVGLLESDADGDQSLLREVQCAIDALLGSPASPTLGRLLHAKEQAHSKARFGVPATVQA